MTPFPLTRRAFLAATGLAGLHAAAATRSPNIVFIILDDLGWGDFGCYGQKLIRTPNIDSVAAAGTRFTDCYAGGTVCAPSRSALMTGLHTGHGAVRANAGTIPLLASDVTVAQVLKRAGYTTGGFGKWGLGDAGSDGIPTRHGFDRFFGYLHQVHAHDYYTDFLWDNDKKYPLPGNANDGRKQYTADVIAEKSFDFLAASKDRPFFLYCCYTLPHAQFEVPSLAPYEKESWPEGAKTYAAMITRADGYVGRILAMLKQHNLEENTVVFVTSDNGAHKGEQKGFDLFQSNGILRGQKGDMYEGGIRVPMMVRWPGKVKAGAVSNVPWAFWDFMPTAAAIAGTKSQPAIDGVSVLPLLTGTRQIPHEFLYWEGNLYDQKSQKMRDDRLSQAVRMGDWKAVRTAPGAPLELYNLRTDPGERKDLASAEPAIVAKIEAYLKTARTPPRPHNTGSMQWVK